MYINKRKLKDGSYYYSFSFDDPKSGKRVRIKKENHPHFTDAVKARAWADAQQVVRAAEKTRLQQQLVWRTTFYDFNALIPQFRSWLKRTDRSKFVDHARSIEYYILPWFLDKNSLSNVNSWHFHSTQFRDYLQHDVLCHRTQKPASIAYKNNIITAYNNWLKFLLQANLLDPQNYKRIDHFSKHLIKYRSAEDVISDDKFSRIHSEILSIDVLCGDLYYIVRHTGMRINELWSLTIAGIYSGQLDPHSALHRELEHQQMTYYGYIVLESQCPLLSRQRDSEGKLLRKPLKSCKKIDPKNNRIIPILDKTCWNLLVKYYKSAQVELSRMRFGAGKDQYLLFVDSSLLRLSRIVSSVSKKRGLNRHSWHCLRHTYATYLVGQTRSNFLARLILGHKSDVFERYVHIYAQIAQEAKQKVQLIEYVG